MTAAVDTDIDAFIREQKLKLASERQALHVSNCPSYTEWRVTAEKTLARATTFGDLGTKMSAGC